MSTQTAAQTLAPVEGTLRHEGEGETAYTMEQYAPITLGKTTYQVEVQTMTSGPDMVWLTGPRGAKYFLRAYLERKGDTGLRQVISWTSGKPLVVRGNEVRVVVMGNLVEAVV